MRKSSSEYGSSKFSASKILNESNDTADGSSNNLNEELLTDSFQSAHTNDDLEKNKYKVSLMGLFRFATFGQKLLLLLGSLFSIVEGSGSPMMALVFGGMAETLILTVKNGLTTNQPVDPAIHLSNSTSIIQETSLPPTELISVEEFEALMSKYALAYLALGVLVYVASAVQYICWQTAAERQTHRIRQVFFRSILRQELTWFDKNQAGDLAVKFNDDVERIREGLGEQFSSIIKNFSAFVAGFVIGFVVSWRLTLVILAASPLLAIFSAYIGSLMASSTKREQEKYGKAGALAEEVLVAVRTVFALGGQRYEISNYTKLLNEGKKIAKWKYFKISIAISSFMLVLYSTYGLALYVATLLLDVSMITPGAAMTVIMSVMMGANALGNIVPPLQTVIIALSSASLVFKVIDSVPRIDASNERGLKLSKVTANIKFEQVKFHYPNRKKISVLKGLSFEVSQGQTVAICGRTGSGKSTIMNLLLRFYDPDKGSIYLDNCNLCDLNVAWFRSLMGVVEQEPALFDCSIFENILLGTARDSEKTYDRVIEAAKLANAHEFIIELHDGYNTRCGDRGVQLSCGQKQRVAIARALLNDPKILLLDEATSALDSESEFIVQSALNRARKGRTTIIIAHRLSTIRDADLILVMESGSIIESGKHEQLMANKGHYHNLVINQVFTDESGNHSEPTSMSDEPSDSEALDGTDIEHLDQVRKKADINLLSLYLTNQGAHAHNERLKNVWRSSSRGTSNTSSSHQNSTTMYESINKPIKNLVEFQKDNQDTVSLPSAQDLYKLLKPEMGLIIIALLASIAVGALMPAFALLYAQILDTFSKSGTELIENGAFWGLMFVGLGLISFITMFLRLCFLSTAVETTMARLRAQCFTNILRQHVGWFDTANHSPQRLTSRLANDIPQIKAVLNSRVSALLPGLSTIIVALVISFCLGWKLAILLTLALPILLYVGFLQMRISRNDQAKHMKRMENVSRLTTEAIEHVKLIQAINQERFFFDKFNQQLKAPFKESLRLARRFSLVYGLSQSCNFFVYGAAFRWGAYLIAQGQIDPIDVFRVFFAISFTAVAVGQTGGIFGDMKRAHYSVGLVMKLLETTPAIDNLSRGGMKPVFKGLVNFQDVYFKYPTRLETPVLQGLNLTIKPGQTVALVGPSGNGKSTLASLLLRFYDTDRGYVRIDNYDVRCINLNHLRLNVGLVSQEPCLFNTSIKENILYGLDKSRYTMKDVKNAATIANIDQFIISLPNGYDTMVGDRGTQLSGGQKQRIAIARTVIRNPIILILDEATSALDTESEAIVNQALEKASEGKTCIKIAHRLSTVRDADMIAVIEKGTVVESGNHDELMALGRKGHYYKLMQKQEITT